MKEMDPKERISGMKEKKAILSTLSVFMTLSVTFLIACQVTGVQMAGTSSETTSTQTQTGQYTVNVSSNPDFGDILVDSQGMTLYTFSADKSDQSTCTSACSDAWPPLAVADGFTPTEGTGVTGTLNTFKRADGSNQVSIDSMPLYAFSQGAKPGDTTGQALNAQGGYWYVVPADIGLGSPDFTKNGFPNVVATQDIMPGQSYTVSADIKIGTVGYCETYDEYSIAIPNGAFDIPVTFELLTGSITDFTAPPGEVVKIAFAFRVTDSRLTGMTAGKFYKPLMLEIISPKIVDGSKYYDVSTDGTLTENATELQVREANLQHPIEGAGVGFVVTSPDPFNF